jgi:MFS transporter, DHA1 family, multidrug resistance protein
MMTSRQSGIGKFIPLLTFIFVFQISRGMTLPVFPLYFHSVSLSAISIGEALGVFGFSFLIFEALWGYLFEKFNAHRLTPIIILANSLGIFAFSRPSSFAELVVIELVLGMGLGGVGVFPRIAIAKVAGNAERGRIFGMLGSFYSFGATFGSLIGGASDVALGLSITFVIASTISVLSLLPFQWHVSLFTRSEEQIVDSTTPSSSPTTILSLGISKLNVSILGFIALGLIGLSMAANNGFFNLLLPNILGQDSQMSANVIDISIVLAIFTLSSAILSPFMSTLGWRNPSKWITSALLITGGLYFTLSQARTIVEVYFVTLCVGISTSSITPLSLSLLTARVPRNFLGRMMGLYGAVEDVGLIIGSSAGSIVWGLWGAEYSFFLIGLIFLVVATIFLLAKRKEPG